MFNEIVWTPDSQRILITTIPDGLSVEEYVQRVQVSKTVQDSSTSPEPDSTVLLYTAASTRPGESPDSPVFNIDELTLHDLALIHVESGKVDFIERGQRIERFALSPDGSKVAYARPKRFYKAAMFRRVYDLVILSLKSKQERVVASDFLLNDEFSWSPDSSKIAFAAYAQDERSYEFYSFDADGKDPRKLSKVLHETSDGLWLSPVWDSRGDRFYFVLDGALWQTNISNGKTIEICQIAKRRIEYLVCQRDAEVWAINGFDTALVLTRDEEGKQDGFYQIDLKTGHSRKLLENGRCYSCYWPMSGKGSYITIASPDGRYVLYVAENAEHAPEMWISDSGFKGTKQLTHLNPQFEKYQFGSAQLIDWLSDDGEPLQGALLLPSNYVPGKRYPLLVWVYPGVSHSRNLDQFSFGEFPGPLNLQLFATRGYAVLFPDATERVGDRMLGLVKSVLPGVNKVVELGIADPSRLGVIGHSQGGFATLEMLVETNRFRAAIAADGWANSTAYYGVMDRGGVGYQNSQAEWQLGGTPWERPLTYIQNSPIYYLDRIETPLLLIHGSEDDEHPAFLSDDVFVGLRRLGKRVEYAKYIGEPHAPSDWSYANQVDLARRAIGWFDMFLK
jgi:dipeptidyl aminopeptidase/acylaminoacyl peptidase